MVILENGKYIVHVPERGIWQDRNPENKGLPFESEKEAQAWQDTYIANFDADLLAQQEQRKTELLSEIQIEEAAKSPPIDLAKLSDADFKKMVLQRLGYAVKEV